MGSAKSWLSCPCDGGLLFGGWHLRVNIAGSSLLPLSLCLLKTFTSAGQIRRRARHCVRLRWVRATSCTSLAYCHLLTASECVERECGLCRLLRKAANRGAGNCVP